VSYSLTFTQGVSGEGENISKSVVIEAGALFKVEEEIPASVANALVAAEIDVSQVKGLFFLSDRDLTVKTNSSSTPANTLNLKANEPQTWNEKSGLVSPLTVDVTALYVSNAAASPATLQIIVIYDPTV
jgi:hypothetical protein